MFGYVRPVRDELKVRELRDYEAVYCGLCRAIGRRSGFAARFFLNYDFVFLAMLLTPVERPEITACRCPARLWCRKKPCAQGEGLDRAADEGTILCYWKLRDTVADGRFFARTGARLLSALLHPGYRRAARRQPEFDRTVTACLGELRALELAHSASLDRTADTFARILQAAAGPDNGEPRTRILGQLLYHIGRWIYLLDAWDDWEEDRRTGAYNPVSARYPDGEEAHRADMRTTLCHSRNLAASAYGLLDSGCWKGILDNMIYLGLPAVEELVFSGRWGRNSRRARKSIQKKQETDT